MKPARVEPGSRWRSRETGEVRTVEVAKYAFVRWVEEGRETRRTFNGPEGYTPAVAPKE
jgi:hypothetical protein